MNNLDNGPGDGNNMLNMNVEVGEEDQRMQSLIITKDVEEDSPFEQTYEYYFYL